MRIAHICAAALAASALAACQTSADRGPAYVTVEQNVSIPDRRLVDRVSLLDDDTLLIVVSPAEYYQAKLTPACTVGADLLSSVQIDETSMGIDRSTRVIIDGQTCGIRSLDRVERRERVEAAAAE